MQATDWSSPIGLVLQISVTFLLRRSLLILSCHTSTTRLKALGMFAILDFKFEHPSTRSTASTPSTIEGLGLAIRMRLHSGAIGPPHREMPGTLRLETLFLQINCRSSIKEQ
jgi:hypothetical protein